MAGGSRRSDVGGTHQRHRPARPSPRPRHDHRRRRPMRGRDRVLPPDPVPPGRHHQPGDPDRRGARQPGPARHPVPSQHTQPAMSTTAVVLVALSAAGFPLLLWAIGRAVTAAGERARHGLGRPRQYLAGRLDGLQITALIDGGDELLVGLGTQDADANQATRPRPTCSVSPPASAPCPGSGAGGMKVPFCSPTSATTAPSCSPIPCWAAMPPASQPPPPPGRTASRQSHRINRHLTTANPRPSRGPI